MSSVFIPAPFPFRTTHSINELCEKRFEESGWTGVYTTDIEDLAGALEEVYQLGIDDLSWVEIEALCIDANTDVATPAPLNALYPAASPPRIRIPSGADEAAKKAAAIHRLVAQDMERPLVPRQVGRVFEEATNAQLRASLRLCGVIPPHEYHDNRAVLVAAYLKAPMVLSNVAQCAHLSGQAKWCDAQIGASTLLSDGGPYEFYPDCLVYGGESEATQVAVSQLPPGVVAAQGLASQQQASLLAPNGATGAGAPSPIPGGPHSPSMPPPAYAAAPANPVMAALMAQLQASQQEALQLKAQLASPARPVGGSLFRQPPPTPIPSVATPLVVTPPPMPKPLGGPGVTPPKVTGAPVPLFGPAAVPALPGAVGAGQVERAQQAKGMVQALHARIAKFPGPTGAGLLAKLADAEAQFVAGAWTPTMFWNWMSQGQEGVSQNEQADLRARLALAPPGPGATHVAPTPVVAPPVVKKRKAADSDSDEEDLASLTQAAYQPMDGCLTGKAKTAMEAVVEMVVANSGAPAERKAYLATDKVEQDAEREAAKECRNWQLLHQTVTRQEWCDKLKSIRVTWEAARVAQTMLEKLLRQVPQDTSQDVAVANATLDTLVKQKTFELRGLENRMDIYMQAHEMMRTSGESIVTIDKWVEDREGEHVKKSASALVREQQLAKIRKSATQKMQNEVVSIQLAHAKVGVFPGSVPGGMPSMGGMGMPQGPAPMWAGFGGGGGDSPGGCLGVAARAGPWRGQAGRTVALCLGGQGGGLRQDCAVGGAGRVPPDHQHG